MRPCNAPAGSGSHENCRAELDGVVWTPCVSCLGGAVALDGGGSCPDCLGLGFWRAESEAAMFGGYTVLIEMYQEMAAEDQQRGVLTDAGYRAEVSATVVRPVAGVPDAA